MSLLGKNGHYRYSKIVHMISLTLSRTADNSEGNKTVGVDPTVITARMRIKSFRVPGSSLIRCS